MFRKHTGHLPQESFGFGSFALARQNHHLLHKQHRMRGPVLHRFDHHRAGTRHITAG